MKRTTLCLVFTMLLALAPTAFGANFVDFSIGTRFDPPTSQGHVKYDGNGGVLSGVDLSVASVTYQTDSPPFGPFPTPWQPYELPAGKLNFSTGNLLRVEGNSLVFGAGGVFSVVGALMVPGQDAFTEELYRASFTDEVFVSSIVGGYKVVAGGYSGRFNDTFADAYNLSQTKNYDGGITLIFHTTQPLVSGFDTFVNSGNAPINVSAVPEPASVSMIGLGFLAILARYCRKQ